MTIYDVDIHRLDLMALFDLKGARADLDRWCGATLPAFPDAPLRVSTSGDLEVMFLGPDHWILRAPLHREQALIAKLAPDTAPVDISIVRVSDTLQFFSVTGPDADEVMAVATPLDLHRDAFAPDGAAFSEAFAVKALILRIPDGYQIGVDRSHAAMFDTCLARSIADADG